MASRESGRLFCVRDCVVTGLCSVQAGPFGFAQGRLRPASTQRPSTQTLCYPPRVMETLFYVRTPSPVGPLFLAASTKGLVRLEFEARMQKPNSGTTQLHES